MSLMRLLAAGRSIMGIKKQPGPYRMNQEHLLPNFAPVHKAAAAGRSPKGFLTRWVTQFGRKRQRRGCSAPAPGARHVQTELSLDTVKVVRNDLSDCDFEVISTVRPAAGPLADGKPAGSQRRVLGMVWNRLSAHLLRQAASDFNLVQKERGKLLSQAGHGNGGAGGS
jgi:hypothetical protein